MRTTFNLRGAITVSDTDLLVGIMDLRVVETATGQIMFAATRGDGWLTAFDLGATAGQTTLTAQWSILAQLLQLESTDLELIQRDDGVIDLHMVGLRGTVLTGVTFDLHGGGFGDTLQDTIPLIDASSFVSAFFWGDGSGGIAAQRGGGLQNLTFDSNGTMTAEEIRVGWAVREAQATEIASTVHEGRMLTMVSYGAENRVALLETGQDGVVRERGILTTEDGLWIDRPGAMTPVTGPDGELYFVLAASGSNSLTVIHVDGRDLRPVDHVLDTRDTRIADPAHVTAVTISGLEFVLAAGSDQGMSLFVMLPGGRLQHTQTIAGSLDVPLHGITDIEVLATSMGARIFVTTQSAPFLAEFSVVLQNPGQILEAGSRGALLTGGAGDDVVIDGVGADTLQGGAGADLFIFNGGAERDVILGFRPGQDQIDLSGAPVLAGLDDVIVLERLWGAELRVGDMVIEVRSANGAPLTVEDFSAETVIMGGRTRINPSSYSLPTVLPPTQVAGPRPEAPAWQRTPHFELSPETGYMSGTASADRIETNGSNDLIIAGFGGDTVRAGDGSDSVDGGSGNDYIAGEAGADLLLGSEGFDTLMGGLGNDTLMGGAHADSLFGEADDDVLLGGDGFDQLFGGDGNDSMWAGASADRLYGGNGDDRMSAGSNFGLTVDGLWGEAGNDTLMGDAGFDLLDGGEGDDLLDGGHQADNLYGRAGNDDLLGSGGLDRLFGGDGDDRLSGGDGNDGHFGEAGNDTAWGGEGEDRFFGGQGNDILMGEAGNDTLYGGAGFDTLTGGSGDDLMQGNFNADRFVFAAGHGHDTILDFDAENSLEVLDFSLVASMYSTLDVLAASRQVGANVLIDTGSDSSIMLLGVDIANFGADDLVF